MLLNRWQFSLFHYGRYVVSLVYVHLLSKVSKGVSGQLGMIMIMIMIRPLQVIP